MNFTISYGETLRFGGYDWIVLDRQDGRALIVTERVIGSGAYHAPKCDVTWAGSDIRGYLNGEFYDAFCEADRAKIAQVHTAVSGNPWLGTDYGSAAEDHIFLLSIEEVVKYFGDSGQLADRPRNDGKYDWFKDEYVLWIDDRHNMARAALDAKDETMWWWLRTPGRDHRTAAIIRYDGGIAVDGDGVHVGGSGGIRPALWLIE